MEELEKPDEDDDLFLSNAKDEAGRCCGCYISKF